MREWDRRRISDDELRILAREAIDSGISRTMFHDNLRGKNIAISLKRLSDIWDELNGPIQERRGGWI